MARPQTDQQATRQELLEIGESLVRERGPSAITVTEIAMACGMSQSNVYRYFPNKESLFEALAERWFSELNAIMEEVVASDLEPREKLYQFFARRVELKRARYDEDPDYFESCMTLGAEHRDVVMSYVDLADHYMATILSEAVANGDFRGFSLDHLVTVTNLMVAPFCDPNLLIKYRGTTPGNLRIVIDALFDGVERSEAQADDSDISPPLKLAS